MENSLEAVPDPAEKAQRGRASERKANPLAVRLRADGHAGIDLREADLRDQDLSGLDLSGADLRGARLNGADLSNAVLSFCQLQGAHLQGAKLDDSQFLGSDLSDADLTECSALRTGLGGATLSRATFTTARLAGATLSRGKAPGARFAGADLQGARIRECDLTEADFSHANLSEADLQETNVAGARFYDADLRGATVRGLIGFTKANWISVDTRDANLRGAHLIRRHIEDANYLHEFRNESRANALLYQLWWLTSDCGRSFTRWAGFTGLLAIAFAAVYGFVAIDFGPNETAISPLYFSVVTLTTLGYGDALPVSMTAQLVVMTEVIIGYMALGGLLSVFATKMARRAE